MTAEEVADQAWSSLQANQLAEARSLFARLVEMQAEDAEAWMMLGTLHGVFGELEPAFACLERAVALEPDYAEAHQNLGKMRLMGGRLDTALVSLRQAVACNPEQTEAWLLLAGLYGRMDRFGEAETASRRILEQLPNSVEARLHLANALRSQGKRGSPDADSWLARPILVLGLARSGTSLVAGCLAACGAWVGETFAGNASNPEGYFENRAVREEVIKTQLRQLGVDPLGVKSLPPLSVLPPQPKLGAQVLELLGQQGYTGGQAWLYKDAKLTLLWPVWKQVFPHARWVIVRRPAEQIVDSCLRTDFMRQHSDSTVFWRQWVKAYEQRLEILKASGAWWREIEPARLISAGPAALESLVSDLGLQWNATGVEQLVKPQHWHGKQAPAPSAVTQSELPGFVPLIVNSVPKSGTHLLGKLTTLLGYSDIPVRLYNNLAPRSMDVEETNERVRVGSVWPCLVPFERFGEILLQVKQTCFIQGHLPYSARVAQLMESFGIKMVLVLRDPRAVAVSHANWVPDRDFLASHGFYQDKSADERLRLAISGYRVEPDGPLELGLRARFAHMLPWMEHPAVYTTRFEWLAGAQAGGDAELQRRELRNIAGHLGVEVPESHLEQVAEELFGGTMTFKGGQIAAWKEMFSEDHKALIKKEMGDVIVDLGYEKDLSW